MPQTTDGSTRSPGVFPAPEHARAHVYVMDSDQGFLELMEELLADANMQSSLELLHPNVEAATEHILAARPTLLILDAIPFRSDAELLLRHLTDHDELRSLPVLLTSTNLALAERLAGEFTSCVRDILPKPFNLDEFYGKIERILKEI